MKLKGLLKVALVLLAVSSLFVACDTIAGGRFPHVEKVYMKPGEDWASDNPVYAAWMWTDGKEGSWTELTKSTIEEDLWEVAVPNEIDNIIFVKMKDGTTKDKFSWDTKEEQTDDLKVPYVFDNVQVYSIKAKEWIAIGAEEKEPEKPVAIAISEAEFKSLKYAASSNPDDIELDADKSFTFYASSKTYKFKYTNGTWAFAAVTGEAITELDKEYPIVKKGDTGYDNIELKNLQDGVEYKVSLTRKDGFAYVKVTKTGKVVETLPEVYFYTVNKANISSEWGGSSEKAAFGVLLLTDEELAAAKTATNYDYLGGAETKLNDKNLLVYTHENGSFILKDEKGTTFENVAAVVTDDSITVYVKVSGTLVEKGKKAYIVALDKNDTPIIDNIWNTSLAAMNANATWPAGELKENKEPAKSFFFEGADIEGAIGNLSLTKVDDNTVTAKFVYDEYRMNSWGSSTGNVHFILRETAGNWNPRYANATLSADGNYVECEKATDGPDIVVSGLVTGKEYEITFKHDNGKVSVKVAETGRTETVNPPTSFFENSDLACPAGELEFTINNDGTAYVDFTYSTSYTDQWDSTDGNMGFKLRKVAGSWDATYDGVTVPVGTTTVLSSNSENNGFISGLEDGETYRITVQEENGTVSMTVNKL